MQKADLKIGARVRIKIYPKTLHGEILEQRKNWGEWEHKVLLTDGTKPEDFPTYYSKRFEEYSHEDGTTGWAVWRSSRDISCKVDENDQPILTATQQRRKKEAIQKQLAVTMKQDAVNDLIRKLGMLGIEAFQGRIQRKYGEHRTEVLAIPMTDAQDLLKLLEPSIADHVKNMFDMFEEGETEDDVRAQTS